MGLSQTFRGTCLRRLQMVTCSRTNKSGGGVALYINDSLQHKYLPDLYKCLVNCAEVVSLKISLKNGKKALICCIYRAPKTDLEQQNKFISNYCQDTRNKTVYLCGDLLQYDTNNVTNNFIDQLYSFGLHPLITRPTRITSHSKTLISSGGLGPYLGRMGTRRTKAPNFVHVLSITIAFILEGEPLQQEGRRRPSWISNMAIM